MLHRDPFVKTIDQVLRRPCGVRPGDRLVLAVSGGADSVAMTRALAIIAARPHWQLRLHLAHVHHHLREDADADAAFVQHLAGELNLACDIRHIQPAAAAGNLEAAARRLRYEALAGLAVELDAAAVVTAHHADDQLETMLMRLIRGAAVGGLSGMTPRRRLRGGVRLIRPMLRVDHAAAVAFCDRMNQAWREDATNAELSRWRSRLRADVLPVLRELRPDAAVKAVDTADALRDAARLADQQVARAIADHVEHDSDGGWRLPRETARTWPAARLRSVLRKLLIDAGARPDRLGRRQLAPILRAARDRSGEPRRFELAGRVSLALDAEAVTCRRAARS